MSKSPTAIPPVESKPPAARRLLRAGAIAALAGLAFAVAALPAPAAEMARAIDTEVVILFVPLCALMLVLLFEVGRMALRGPVAVPNGPEREARAIRHWPEASGDRP